jgi:hypothetical protein
MNNKIPINRIDKLQPSKRQEHGDSKLYLKKYRDIYIELGLVPKENDPKIIQELVRKYMNDHDIPTEKQEIIEENEDNQLSFLIIKPEAKGLEIKAKEFLESQGIEILDVVESNYTLERFLGVYGPDILLYPEIAKVLHPLLIANLSRPVSIILYKIPNGHTVKSIKSDIVGTGKNSNEKTLRGYLKDEISESNYHNLNSFKKYIDPQGNITDLNRTFNGVHSPSSLNNAHYQIGLFIDKKNLEDYSGKTLNS